MELGLSEAELWRLTPRAYRALSDRVSERERRQDWRFGTVAAVAANLMRDSRQRPSPYQPADFFPHLAAPTVRPARPATRVTDEQVAAGWEAWAALCRASS